MNFILLKLLTALIIQSSVVFTFITFTHSNFQCKGKHVSSKFADYHNAQKNLHMSWFNFGARQSNKELKVPKNYDEIYGQAIDAVQGALKAGVVRMEIDFPPLQSLNKLGDGSAKNRKLALECNCSFVSKLTNKLLERKAANKVWILCCEPGTRQELSKSFKPNLKIEIIDMPASPKKFPNCSANDVHVVVTPGDESQWGLARDLGKNASVIICNGLFSNGFAAFDPIYYFKPISGWGYLVKSWPSDWTVFSSRTGKIIPCKVDMISIGEYKRPNLGLVSSFLRAEYAKGN